MGHGAVCKASAIVTGLFLVRFGLFSGLRAARECLETSQGKTFTALERCCVVAVSILSALSRRICRFVEVPISGLASLL